MAMMPDSRQSLPMPADPHALPPDRAQGATPAAVPAALAAFLRGIERRGAVLAELQGGDAQAGDAALAAAMRAFRTVGPGEPMARWPLRFWALLLATPQLRSPAPDAAGDEEAAWLSRLSPGPRAAILLRLAAGLDEGDAAHALAVARPVYRRALRRALPRREDGRADPAAWLRLRAHVHRRIKTLPAERLASLARLREDALAGRNATHAPPPRERPGWLLPSLQVAAAACAIVFVGTFAWPAWEQYAHPLRSETLPAERPAERFDAEAALLSHRDFELLADPDGDALAQDLAFLSWLANQPAIVEARQQEAEAVLSDEPPANTEAGDAAP